MTDLDRRLDAAVGELHDRLAVMRFAPPAAVERRHRHRVRVVTAAALVTALAGAAGLGLIVTRREAPIDSASSPLSPFVHRMADSLLYPSPTAGAGIDHVTFGPDSGSGLRALVRAPSGNLFEVGISERGGSEWTPDLEQRTIGSLPFTVEPFEGELAYTSLDECTLITVSESPKAVTSAWDQDATALMTWLQLAESSATLTLPTGWTSTEVSRPGQLIQMGFAAPVDGVRRAASMMQLPNTSIAALLPIAGGPLEETTFDGQPAYITDGGIQPTLVWQDGDNAVLLGSVDASVDDLRALASSLEHGHADKFVAYMWGNVNTASEGTLPPEIAAATAGCAPPELSVVTP